jgi:hypothetical protein
MAPGLNAFCFLGRPFLGPGLRAASVGDDWRAAYTYAIGGGPSA